MIIVQIGTNDGNDHVFDFVKNVDCYRIILIDANPRCTEKVSDRYVGIPNVEFYNMAIVPYVVTEPTTVKLLVPTADETSAHASLQEEHMSKHGHTSLDSIEVNALDFHGMLGTLKIDKIDRLYIDVEGLDIDIINSIDFKNICIPYVMFEYIHSDGTLSWGGVKLDDCLRRLASFGYDIEKVAYNIIATKSI
jgi:FkbM family methyltransferase